MTDITPFDAIPAQAPLAPPAKPRLLLIGTALVSLAVTMGFAGLVGFYLSSRAEVLRTGERWLPKGVDIPLTQPNMMMVTLVARIDFGIDSMLSDQTGASSPPMASPDTKRRAIRASGDPAKPTSTVITALPMVHQIITGRRPNMSPR